MGANVMTGATLSTGRARSTKKDRNSVTKTMAAISLCLLLSACSSNDEVALNTVRREPTPASTTTGAPTTTTTTIPTISRDTRLTLNGLGPVIVGLTPAQVEERSDLTIETHFAGGTGRGGPQECRIGDVVGGALGVSVMTIGDEIARVDVVDNSAIQTLSGLSIGDNEAEVQQLYPTATKSGHAYIRGGWYYTYRSVNEPQDRALVVEVGAEGKVIRFRAGKMSEVTWVEGCA